MRITKLLTLMAAATLLASCDTDELQPASGLVKKTFVGNKSSIEAPSLSKTFLESDGLTNSFAAGEAISVFDSETYANNSFTASATGTTSEFTGTAPVAETYYMLCPYLGAATFNGTTISATLKTSQTATAGTYDPEAGLSVAVCDDGETFQLKNVISILRIQTSEACTEIDLTALNGESLAGVISINPSDASFTVASGASTVSLSGTMAAGTYYFAVLPAKLTKGMKLTFHTSDGQTKTKSYEKALEFVRSSGLNCGLVSEYDEVEEDEDPVVPEGFAFTADQYQKALWMTTRFYGAQRMGNGVNWLTYGLGSGDYAGGKSFLKDKDGDYDLTGGWFDCGDYVLFGNTFFYSTYVLLLGYSEFKAGYLDKYDADYSCYTSTGKYSWEDNTHSGNGVADVVDECKYAVDYIKKALRSTSQFYYQKGNGYYDHNASPNAQTSPTRSANTVANGGESDGTRPIYSSVTNVTSMASLAGASLAVMYRLTGDEECLTKAKIAYTIATSSLGNSTDANGGSFYGSKSKYYPDLTILCAELYRATSDSKYLDKCNEYSSQWIENNYDHGWTLCYNNTEDLGLYAYCAMGTGTTYYDKAKANMAALVAQYKCDGTYLLKHTSTGWGDLRYCASQCFSMALNAKLQGETEANLYVLKSVEYMMGSNSNNFSFITGFTSNSPKYPHHRNYYRMDASGFDAIQSSFTSSDDYAFRQLGYLVGGTYDGSFNDYANNYQNGEGGIDYNCGLVGALAYLNTFIK